MGEPEENSTFIEEGGEGPQGLPRETMMHINIGLQVVYAVTGVIGNTLVLYIFGRRRERLTSTLGILTLAGKDLFLSAVVIPYLAVVEAYNYHIKYDFFCKLLHFFLIVQFAFTPFLMTGIAVDRCACVCHTFLHVTKIKRARIIILAMFLIATAVAVLPTLCFGVYRKNYNFLRYRNTSNLINNTYLSSAKDHVDVVYSGWCHMNDIILPYDQIHKYHTFYFFLFAAPLTCTGLLYTATFVFVQYGKRKSQRAGPKSRMTSYPAGEITRETPDGASDDDHEETQEGSTYNYREQIHLTLVMFTAALVCFALFLLTWLMAHQVLPFNLIIFYFYLIHCASNPIVYVCMDSLFRKELKDLIHRRWVRIDKKSRE